MPIKLKTRRGETVFDTDEHLRARCSPEDLAKLRPVFRKDGTVMLAGDTPAIDDSEIDAMLRRLADGPEVVIVPDRHGDGTNALLLTPPDVMTPSFGPGSRERHERLAREAGADVRVSEVESLLLDVDTADDLEVLAHGLAGRRVSARCTRATP